MDKKQHLFQQDEIKTAPLVLSQSLEKHGGIAKAYEISGIYNKNNLKKYFNMLRDTFILLKHPTAIKIVNFVHAITISYDPDLDNEIYRNS